MTNSLPEKKKHEISINKFPADFREVCKAIGLDKAFALAKALGGESIYIPKTESLLRDVKHAAIKQEFDGSNVRELAIKYGYSARWIRSIVNQT